MGFVRLIFLYEFVFFVFLNFFFFKQKTAYEISACLVGSEMCIRDRGGAVLVETVFSWPGIGRLLVDCIGLKDTPVVVACVLVLATMFTIINLCIDILYAFLDPRIRAQYKTAKR